MAVRIQHGAVVKNAVKLLPLGVCSGPQDSKGLHLKALQRLHFDVELLQGLRCS